MTKLHNPRLFSDYFGIATSDLMLADLLDPFLNGDTKLFIDPMLLATSSNHLIKTKGSPLFRDQLSIILKLLMATRNDNDPAWTAAMGLLNLNERRETCLGYGGSGVSGSSRPDSLKVRILKTTQQVLNLGIDNPEIISFMGVFEADVGPDTISDLTTNTIFPVLQEITLAFCAKYSIPVRPFVIGFEEYSLPINPLDSTHGFALVPKDILRELPVATDWSDIDRVIRHNAMLRHRMNGMVMSIAKATVTEKKEALKTVALESQANFQAIFDGLMSSIPKGYDFKRDRKNLEALRDLLASTARDFPLTILSPATPSAAELWRVVGEITTQFKHLIENGDLSRLLWDGDNPKPEKASQLVFFGIADCYCKANNIDISPEVHSGGGPVDFKFSTGYFGRLLVEMKLSTGTVVHGYEKQLEVYKTAAQTEQALFLIVDVGGMKGKLVSIKARQAAERQAGHRVSEIVVVDAKRKASASNRKS